MFDFEQAKRYYKVGQGLSWRDVYRLVKACKLRKYRAGEYLIEDGSTRKDVFFIVKGLVRGFKLNQEGNEVTISIRWEYQFVDNYEPLSLGLPSSYYYQALENTHVYWIDLQTLQQIVSDHPVLEANRRFVFRNLIEQAYQRIESLLLLSPEERYLAFMRQQPAITNRIQDKYLAQYLGMTPVTLSRIRKRIATDKK